MKRRVLGCVIPCSSRCELTQACSTHHYCKDYRIYSGLAESLEGQERLKVKYFEHQSHFYNIFLVGKRDEWPLRFRNPLKESVHCPTRKRAGQRSLWRLHPFLDSPEKSSLTLFQVWSQSSFFFFWPSFGSLLQGFVCYSKKASNFQRFLGVCLWLQTLAKMKWDKGRDQRTSNIEQRERKENDHVPCRGVLILNCLGPISDPDLEPKLAPPMESAPNGNILTWICPKYIHSFIHLYSEQCSG